MYNNNEIDETEYRRLYTIFEYERLKYQGNMSWILKNMDLKPC